MQIIKTPSLMSRYVVCLLVLTLHPVACRHFTQKGHEKRATTILRRREQPLARIVLAIAFSEPFFENIAVEQWMYQHFGRIVFCADLSKADTSTTSPSNVHNVPVGYWFQHRCLMKAMTLYPDFDGYIGSNDDVVLHPWVINTWDTGKVWFEHCKRVTPLHQTGLLVNHYIPGNVAVDHLGDMFPYGKQALKKVHDRIPGPVLDNLQAYTGYRDAYCEGDNDFIYIPGRHSRAFLELATLFDSVDTGFPWLYSAVVYGLFNQTDVVHPNGTWLWGAQRRAPLPTVYNAMMPLVHPVKFSDKTNVQSVVAVFEDKLGVAYPQKSRIVFPVYPVILPPPAPPCQYNDSKSFCPKAEDA